MLYTGHGDSGYTQVIGGPRLLKCDLRLEALGALDEAQAHLGLSRALLADSPWNTPLRRAQDELRLAMAEVAMPGSGCACYLADDHLAALEADLNHWEARTCGFIGFTIPGASVPEAHLHLARTVIRRAERAVVALCHEETPVPPLLISYLNRLSSWIYALTLLVTREEE